MRPKTQYWCWQPSAFSFLDSSWAGPWLAIGSTSVRPTAPRDLMPPSTGRHIFFLLRDFPIGTRWQRRNWWRLHRMACWLFYYNKKNSSIDPLSVGPTIYFSPLFLICNVIFYCYYFLYFIKYLFRFLFYF